VLSVATLGGLAVAVVGFSLWHVVRAQTPAADGQLVLVNADEEWIERKKQGEFRARPIFNQQLTELYYGIRDADTGEWLTAVYRVSGGEKERDEGWEYEFDYPSLDEHEPLDPERTYLMVILAAADGQPAPTTFYAVIPAHQSGGLLGNLLGALDPARWARALAGWVEGEYHQTPHRGLNGQTPLDRWARTGAEARYPDDDGLDLEDLFLFQTKRRVNKDRTVSLHGHLYEADAVLVGQTVVVRYDPSAPPTRPLQLVHEGRPAGLATPLDAYANATVKRVRPSQSIEPTVPAPEPPPSPLALRRLKETP